ncbi:MAG: hypothetical protein ACRERE_06855 [Candidatus Entotheonellia bacterium]
MTVSIRGEDEIPERLKSRSTGLLDRLAFYRGYRLGERDPFWRQVIAALHA